MCQSYQSRILIIMVKPAIYIRMCQSIPEMDKYDDKSGNLISDVPELPEMDKYDDKAVILYPDVPVDIRSE